MTTETYTPNPSDFGKYTYCGFKWLYEKNSNLKNNVVKSANSKRYLSKKMGQQNEGLCIDWILNRYDSTTKDIVFNGTGLNNYDYLTTKVSINNEKMLCQPDLILEVNNKNLLFEFKATSEEIYAFLETFDSVYAQIWCYSYIEEIKIEEFYLLKYFVDPFENPFNDLSKLTNKELDSAKFLLKYDNYIQWLSLINQVNDKGMSIANLFLELGFNKLNIPSTDSELKIKCSNCYLKKQGKCVIWG